MGKRATRPKAQAIPDDLMGFQIAPNPNGKDLTPCEETIQLRYRHWSRE